MPPNHRPEAAPLNDLSQSQPRVHQREKTTQRGYGAKWRKVRAVILRREPLCRACRSDGLLVVATDVDHILPKSDGGAEMLSNLQPLCHRHHSIKTARRDGGFGNKQKK